MLPSSRGKFLHTHSREPVGVTRNGGDWPEPRHGFSLAACARWEARYIVEWLTYHRSIGIEHVYLYCNDDDPAELYEKVLPFLQGSDPFVTFVHYNMVGLQFQMYFHFLRNYSHETRWLMFLDIDEFICVKEGNNVPLFMKTFGDDVDAVYFNWCSFGHNGHRTRPSSDVLTTYTRRERTATPFTKVFIKSRSVPYHKFYLWSTAPVMHDYVCLDDKLNVVNVLGENLSFYYEDFPKRAWDYLLSGSVSENILAKAFIAHFNIKSDEDFDLRVARGLKGDYRAEAMWGEKSEAARQQHHALTNAVEDLYLHDYWSAYRSRGRSHAVFPYSRWSLLSEGCYANQSSTAHAGTIEEDAVRIISGRPNGRAQNHTEIETNPWWLIRFDRVRRIHEFRLFNRLDDVFDRMANFSVYSSTDETEWVCVYSRQDPAIFGGIDGSAFVWTDEQGFEASSIRLVVPGEGKYLHLDQIQFYGDSD